MTAAFSPIPVIRTELPVFMQEIPVPNRGAGTPRHRSAVDVRIDWSSAEGSALLALLLRAAYFPDGTWLNRICPFIPGYRGFNILADPALGDWRPVFIDCGTYRIFVMHGVKTSAQYSSIIQDYLVPRYTAGGHQLLSTVGPVGDFVANWFNTNEPSSPPVLMAAHSFGGIISAYWLSKAIESPTCPKATFYGVPKMGPVPCRDVLIGVNLTNWATREDPFVGLPPSHIRLADVPFLAALFPAPFGLLAAAAIKVRLDATWNPLQSADTGADSLNQDVTVGRLENIDSGRNWYTRTGIGVSSIFTFAGLQNIVSHRIRVYYDRLRALFGDWASLSDAAGPGGREADVQALAITAAELGG